jgi:hypothetical protein
VLLLGTCGAAAAEVIWLIAPEDLGCLALFISILDTTHSYCNQSLLLRHASALCTSLHHQGKSGLGRMPTRRQSM